MFDFAQSGMADSLKPTPGFSRRENVASSGGLLTAGLLLTAIAAGYLIMQRRTKGKIRTT